MKIKLLKFKSVKSTNDIALGLIKKKKITPVIISSERQTHGRGTMGKKWVSKKGNLFLYEWSSIVHDHLITPIDKKSAIIFAFSS